jgi:hypothetical protein
LKRAFWQFVHDRLEAAWHWVYYHKLARPLPPVMASNITYTIGYSAAPAIKKPDDPQT